VCKLFKSSSISKYLKNRFEDATHKYILCICVDLLVSSVGRGEDLSLSMVAFDILGYPEEVAEVWKPTE
jgi:hypothetical protein